MHLYRKEVEEAMIANVRQAAIDLMEDWKGSHHESLWPESSGTLPGTCGGEDRKDSNVLPHEADRESSSFAGGTEGVRRRKDPE